MAEKRRAMSEMSTSTLVADLRAEATACRNIGPMSDPLRTVFDLMANKWELAAGEIEKLERRCAALEALARELAPHQFALVGVERRIAEAKEKR